MIGFPFNKASGFAGKRVEAYLAGIIATNFIVCFIIVIYSVTLSAAAVDTDRLSVALRLQET